MTTNTTGDSATPEFPKPSRQGPVLRSSLPYQKVENVKQNYPVNLHTLATFLKHCQYCTMGPLDLCNISETIRTQGICPVLKVRCSYCQGINVLRPSETHRSGTRSPPIFDMNSLADLGAFHTGLGHTQYQGILSVLGLPSMCSKTFKVHERKSGRAIERTAKRSCAESTMKERALSAKEVETEEDVTVKIGVSYDMGWRKRGRSYDSSSGVGTAIGVKTGKVLSYSTRNTACRICDVAEREDKEAHPHDCRRNHKGSSKSMESNVAVELFNEAVKNGVSYSSYVGDDDTTTESRLKTLVNYEIEKFSDINHSTRTLGSRLYTHKGKVKGLTPTVIAYIQKCFTYCVNQNKNDPISLLAGLNAIVPHAFGNHQACSTWCKHNADPDNYCHTDLPGGKDLSGNDLRVCLEDALSPFLTEEAAKKLAPVGSSQRNECLNSIIGTKALKTRHYGDSESADFRTSAGIAQFNEGYSYITAAGNELGITVSNTTQQYVRSMEKKRAADSKRKKQKAFKKSRKNKKKRKTRKTHSMEAQEGATYETGIGLQEDDGVTNGTLNDLRASLTREEFHKYSEYTIASQTSTTTNTVCQVKNEMIFDLETTGLDRNAEILQIACIRPDSSVCFERYLLPDTRTVADSATKIHGISVQYKDGGKIMQKNGQNLRATGQRQGLTEFVAFLEKYLQKTDGAISLIAHNGERFDFRVLINSLSRYNLLESFMRLDVLFIDSLKVAAQEMKLKDSPIHGLKSKSLSSLYEALFGETFDAHDARDDVKALARILFDSNLKVASSSEGLSVHAVGCRDFKRRMDLASDSNARKSTLQNLKVSDGMKDKLAKAGLKMNILEGIYQAGGSRGLLFVLALPVNFDDLHARSAKPRVSKNLRFLTQIIHYFDRKTKS